MKKGSKAKPKKLELKKTVISLLQKNQEMLKGGGTNNGCVSCTKDAGQDTCAKISITCP
jgi:hypothetical protein